MKTALQLFDELKFIKFSYPNDNIDHHHSIEIAINEAQNLINAGHYEKSLFIMKKIEKQLKRNKEKQFLAECYIINRKYEIALDILLDLLKTDKSNCHILSLCSGIYLNTGDIANAIKYNEKILNINQNYKAACINKAFFNKHRNNKDGNNSYPPIDCEISIFTSIPPNNPSQSVLPIESWHKLGFHVYSCNYKEEIQSLKNYFPKVQFVEIEQPEIYLYGKKTIRLVDIFKAIAKHGSQISGIINSDILLRCEMNFKFFIINQCYDATVYGSRVDVNNFSEYDGRMYDNGFDFFFFRKDILNIIPDNLFALGHPWWDYFFPMSIFANNNKLKQLNAPIAFHQKHRTNWDANSLYYYGLHMTQFFSNDIFSFIKKTFRHDSYSEILISSVANIFSISPRILEYFAEPIYYYDKYTKNAFSILDVFKEKYQFYGTKIQFLE